MISISRQLAVVAFAGACVALFSAGCKTAKPKAAPPAPTQTEPRAATEKKATPEHARPRPPTDAADNMNSNILAWDSVEKVYRARLGDTNAPFTFAVTNISPQRVLIFDTSTTCDCTVAKLPSKPWILQPGAGGELHASLDLRNRTTEAVTNYVIVFTSKGNRLLTVGAILPKK